MFFSLYKNRIVTKPMKGTLKRGKNAKEDKVLKNYLHKDIKNRAENIMIVDLLRNDLGKISKPGSVKVNKLFEIETYKTLFQMTSEISSELENGITLYDIISSIFPCGSITGAPKISTMKVIEETEVCAREIYCGAIGYLHKDEAIFSVPIRILQKKNKEIDYRYHTGGAIVWDSTAEDEWKETVVKTKFLETNFSLIETCKNDFNLHIKRLKCSAKELRFKWNKDIEKIKFQTGIVTRIELFKNGHFKVTTREIPSVIKNAKIKLNGRVESSNPFLYHKTSIRESNPKNIFEEIKINERGEITEGVFTNIAILKGNKIYTPPVSCGLLNGITRQKLLRKKIIEEKIIYPKDLKEADKIFCFNSIRGIIEVELCS